ncbi:MAG: TIGR01212 family radical SAM protein [Bacillota bacterium]|nr:TIGR01212 family radical SAM protein [Bacillota bacterium]
MFENKRYRTLSYELKKIFGKKVIKLSIDGGFTCPNRDGTIGEKGCLFCSEEGSGEFAGDSRNTISRQMDQQKKLLKKKWDTELVIPYFQAFTSTYDSISKLKIKYDEALRYSGAVGLAVATRPDCLESDKVELLSKYNKDYLVWVELGLQTIHKKSADLIRRGYDLKVFEDSLKKLNYEGIKAVVHVIIGLPGESKSDIIKTIKYLSSQNIWGIKFHLLHILKDTDLEKYYYKNKFKLLEKDEYIDIICDAIEYLRDDIVVHRVTGDGKKSDLIAPRWSLDKLRVLSGIDMELKKRNSYQGIKYLPQ